jgi:hypothetical protein
MTRKIFFIGNSNNEMARIAHELSKFIDNSISLILIQKETLNDPICLPYYSELKQNIKIRDFRFEYGDLFKRVKLICYVNFKIPKNSIIVMNHSAPAMVLRRNLHKIFVSTGTDITTYANWKWARQINSVNKKYFINLNLGISVFRFIFVSLQRSNIKQSMIIVRPKISRDPTYNYVFEKLYNHAQIKLSFQFSQLRDFSLSPNANRIDAPIRFLIGCRLDDGLEYSQSTRTAFNDKNPYAIYKAISSFNPNCPVEIFYIRKGKWASKFDKLSPLSPLISLKGLEEMPYSAFIQTMQSVDIVIDSIGPSIPGRVSIDALALNKYLIVNKTNFIFNDDFAQHIFHAENQEDLTDVLYKLINSNIIEHRKKCNHDINFRNIFDNSDFNYFISLITKLAKS